MTSSEQFTPTGGQTIFPRINFLKTFSSRFDQRSTNGRIFLSGVGGGSSIFADAALDLNLASSLSLVDSVSGNNLITFSRASSGTYVDSDGLIKTTPVNLLTYSEQFDQSAWTKTAGVTTNTSISPDGSQTADTIPQQSDSTLCVARTVPVSNGVTYTCSVYLKQGTSSTTGVQFFGTGAGIDETVILNFDTESVNNGSVENAGNGWYRISKTVTATGSANPSLRVGIGTGIVYIWGAQLEESSTATTYIPTGATISGAPRFDHDPVTGESLGLLIEEGRTNLAKYSEPDSRSTNGVSGEWNCSNLDPNTEITKVEGPDGVSNSASEMQLATGSREDAFLKSVVVSSAQKYTFSAWVKLGTATNFALHVNDTTAWDSISDGVYSFDANDGLNTNTFVKVSHTFTAPAGGPVNVHIGRHLGVAPAQQTQGTVTVWGCQVELGAFSSSTIITSGSTVTRAPDVASIEGTNFSSWYNQSEGTVFVELGSEQGGVPARFQLSDAGGTNRIQNRKSQLYCFNGTEQFNLSYTSSLKEASAFSGTSTSVAVSGSVVATHGAATLPTCTNIELGKRAGLDYLNGHITRLAYFPTRKTDQELIDLTN